MDAIIKAALMTALVVAATWPLVNLAKSELSRVDAAGIQRSAPIASFLMSDEDMQYGD